MKLKVPFAAVSADPEASLSLVILCMLGDGDYVGVLRM